MTFWGTPSDRHRRFRTGQRILTANPSKKAQKRLQEKVNALLYRGNPEPWPELRLQLNRLLMGWANYFSFGWTAAADRAVWWHVARRARRFLCRRHKLRSQGVARFSASEVYGSAAVLDIKQYRDRKGRLAHASS